VFAFARGVTTKRRGDGGRGWSKRGKKKREESGEETVQKRRNVQPDYSTGKFCPRGEGGGLRNWEGKTGKRTLELYERKKKGRKLS